MNGHPPTQLIMPKIRKTTILLFKSGGAGGKYSPVSLAIKSEGGCKGEGETARLEKKLRNSTRKAVKIKRKK